MPEENISEKEEKEVSFKEQRIRKITQMYYSRPEIQKILFEFSENRECVPRFFEGFGKRPDAFQYKSDIFELVKKGATSFHCSQERWRDVYKIQTGMSAEELNSLRSEWDLLIDVDCKWFDYSKLAARAIIETLKAHGMKNFGIKFSGSKGWHILIPWKAIPKEINGKETKNMFPEVPRELVSYIRNYSEKLMSKSLPENFYEQFKGVKIRRGYKCKKCGELAIAKIEVEFKCASCGIIELKKFDETNIPLQERCYKCKKPLNIRTLNKVLNCDKCHQWEEGFTEFLLEDLFELMGLDLILISPRHLFRMPYSLHEKTALASVVISEKELDSFDFKMAEPFTCKLRNFIPDCHEGEARELVIQALDWAKEQSTKKEPAKMKEFKKIEIKNFSAVLYPPVINSILGGLVDGKKRALFALINFFRSVGLEKDELEKIISDWNQKNNPKLHEGYIKTQISWSYQRKPMLPPNYDKNFYEGIGIIPTEQEKRLRNPVNYVLKKQFAEENKKESKKKSKSASD